MSFTHIFKILTFVPSGSLRQTRTLKSWQVKRRLILAICFSHSTKDRAFAKSWIYGRTEGLGKCWTMFTFTRNRWAAMQATVIIRLNAKRTLYWEYSVLH